MLGEYGRRLRAQFSLRRIARTIASVLVFGLIQTGITSSSFALPAQGGSYLTAGSGGCRFSVGDASSSLVEVTSNANYCVAKFKSGTNSWTPPEGVTSVWVLVIGGGGAGGYGRGGGGGAGGFYENKNYAVVNQSYLIEVGNGGPASTSVVNAGEQSVFGSTIVNGGGGGGSHGDPRPWVYTGSTETRTTGASGGGSGMNYVGYSNGGGPSGVNVVAGVFANAGANSGSTGNDVRNTGGGGGAGSAGVSGSDGNKTGSTGTSPDGGAGKASTITGTSAFYAAGGGGAVGIATSEYNGGSTGTANYSSAPKGIGGSEIGGNGHYPTGFDPGSYVAATAGAANTGSGGGGGGADATAVAGGAGGSGVVIVRWLPPVIASSISDITLPESHSAVFSYSETAVAGITSTTRQWQYSSDGGTIWNNFVGGTGATTVTYKTALLSIASNGLKIRGSTTISNGTETTTSYTNIATLTVILDPSGDTDTAITVASDRGYSWASDAPELDISGSITMAAWVKPTAFAVGNWSTIINKGLSYELGIVSSDGINGYYAYGFSGYSGTAVKEFAGVVTNIKVKLDEWHHVAVTRETGTATAKLYLDGNLVYIGTADSATTGSIYNSTYPLVVGARSNNGSTFITPFTGQIDHVQVWDIARTASNLATDMHTYTSTTTSGLRLFYDFNERGGSTVYNKVSGSLITTDLTVIGSPTWSDVKIVDTTTASVFTIVKFPRTYLTRLNKGWLVPTEGAKYEVFSLGGGGGGGFNGGGGGSGSAAQVCPASITGTGYQSVVVGQGGTGSIGSESYDYPDVTNATNGQNSSFGGFCDSIRGYAGSDSLTSSSLAGNSVGGQTVYGVGFTGGRGGYGSNYGNAYRGVSTAGANGYFATIEATSKRYGAGGGGGGLNNSGSAGGLGGGGAGGSGASEAGTNGVANSGSGGGGAAGRAFGGAGGSGIVVVRWLTITKPIYSQPQNVSITVGMNETFSVNMISDSATAFLTRTFTWESSTNGANGPFTVIKTGTGISNTFFTWKPTDTSTSGDTFLYRVKITDAGEYYLSVSDTSNAVYATISAGIRLVYPSVVTKTVGVSRSVTMSASGGSAPLRYSLSGVTTLFSIDTSTVGSPILKISDSITVGTYYETITVTDSNTATSLAPITIIVSAPPSFGASSTTIDTGTVLFLDAGNSVSYPKSGKLWNDISGRNLAVDTNYVFSSPQARTFADGSSASNTHIKMKSTTCTTPTYTSEANGSLSFDGRNCGFIPTFGAYDSYTVEIWMKRVGDQNTSGYSSPICTVTRDGSDQINVCLSFGNGNKIFARLRNSTGIFDTSGLTTPNNTWFHLALTFNGSLLKMMIDNDLARVDSKTVTGSWNKSLIDAGLIFGKVDDFDSSTVNFVGSIGSVRIYNRVLTSAELTINYNATKGRYLNTLNNSNVSKKWGVAYSDTFTITAGSETLTAFASSSSNSPLIVWDTSTARSSKLTIQSGLTSGTYYETLTATDSNGSMSYLPIKIVVSAGDTITVTVETATVMTYNGKPAAIYPRVVIKGLSGTDSATVQTSFTSLTYTDSLTVPTNADTYTVRGTNLTFTSGSLSNYAGVVYETSTLTINKARQSPLNIFMYGGTVGLPYLIWLQGGNGTGVVTETLTGVSTLTGCGISNHYLSAVEQKQGFCEVRVVKAGDQNYFAETSTVQMYFMAYVNNQPSGQVGSGSTIALNGATSFETSTVSVPSITGFSTLTLSLSSGGNFTITGTGFTGTVTVKFNRNKVISVTPVDAATLSIPVSSIQSVGATSGRVAVITAAGEGVSDQTLTINP